jgi:hypothetical protein
MSEEQKTEEKKDEKKQRVQIRDITNEGAAKNKELKFTKRIHLTCENEDGETLEGDLTLTRPNIAGEARIGVIMADLRQDKPLSALDRNTARLHEWLATCMVMVTSAPPWWDPENSYDSELLMRVYAEALAFWQSFRKPSVG